MRIGINLGDVIIDGDDVYGDGVNIAARLEGLGEPGGIVISGTAYDQAKNKLDVAFESLGEQNLKNIAEPVRVYRVAAGAAAGAKSRGRGGGSCRRRGGVAGAGGGGSRWRCGRRRAPSCREHARRWRRCTGKPSIAVLPFGNLGDEAEQDYFAEGLTDDLITDLSKISGLLVIARNSAFAYKDRAQDVRQVAEHWACATCCEGSVRRAGDSVRINAQLIDAHDREQRLGRAL